MITPILSKKTPLIPIVPHSNSTFKKNYNSQSHLQSMHPTPNHLLKLTNLELLSIISKITLLYRKPSSTLMSPLKIKEKDLLESPINHSISPYLIISISNSDFFLIKTIENYLISFIFMLLTI
jgi:hypothetical protein